MDKKNWIIVANGSIARVLERDEEDENRWAELKCMPYPEGRLHGAELTAGDGHHSIAGRTGLARRLEPKQHARKEFAQRVADMLQGRVGHNEIGSLVIFASNPFLGELLGHLDAETRKLLLVSHPVDLTHLNLTELTHRLIDDFKVNERRLVA